MDNSKLTNITVPNNEFLQHIVHDLFHHPEISTFEKIYYME